VTACQECDQESFKQGMLADNVAFEPSDEIMKDLTSGFCVVFRLGVGHGVGVVVASKKENRPATLEVRRRAEV
jgi:hypothetical protein